MYLTSYRAAPILLKIRKLILRHDALDLVALDVIAKASVGLDRQAANDGVDPRLFGLQASLRALRSMTNGVVQPVDMGHIDTSSDRLIANGRVGSNERRCRFVQAS